MKWPLILLMTLMMIPLASAVLKDCEGPTMSPGQLPCMIISSWQFPEECGTHTIKIYNEIPTLIRTATMGNYTGTEDTGRCNITFGIASNETALGSYVLNWSSGDSSKLIIQSDDKMASLSVTLFIGAITLALFYLGIKHEFSKSSVANIIIKRCMVLLAMFLMSLNTTIVVTMADNAGLGVSRELFRYLWMINWTIYLMMVALVWTTIVNVLHEWQEQMKQKRMGNGRDEYY